MKPRKEVSCRWSVFSPSACRGAPSGRSAASTGRWRSRRSVCSRPERATAAESAASRGTPAEEEEHRGQRSEVTRLWTPFIQMLESDHRCVSDVNVSPDTAWAQSAAASPSSPGRRRPASSCDWLRREPPGAPAARRCRPAGSDGCSGWRRSSDTCSCWRSSASPGKETEERNVSISPAVTFLNCSTCFHAALFVCHVNSYFKTAESCSKDLVLACVKTRKKKKKNVVFVKTRREKKYIFLFHFYRWKEKFSWNFFSTFTPEKTWI